MGRTVAILKTGLGQDEGYYKAGGAGEKMPVAIALGADPASIYAASAPLPPNIDEYLFAGFLRKEPVRLARAASVDLLVPAEAEIVVPYTGS